MNALAIAGRAAFSLVVCLVAAALAASFVISFFDDGDGAGWITWLSYAVWIVSGALAGLFAYDVAGGWTLRPEKGKGWIDSPGAQRTGTIILVTDTVLLAAFGPFMSWSTSGALMIVFVLAIFGALVIARTVGMPARHHSDT